MKEVKGSKNIFNQIKFINKKRFNSNKKKSRNHHDSPKIRTKPRQSNLKKPLVIINENNNSFNNFFLDEKLIFFPDSLNNLSYIGDVRDNTEKNEEISNHSISDSFSLDNEGMENTETIKEVITELERILNSKEFNEDN